MTTETNSGSSPGGVRDPAALLQRIDALWDDTWRAVSALTDDELAAVPAAGEPPPKVVIAHFSRWEVWHREAIREHLADGSVRSYKGYNGWNDAWAAADAALTPAEARQRLRESHEQLRALLDALSASQWDDHVYAFAEQPTLNHYALHAAAFTRR